MGELKSPISDLEDYNNNLVKTMIHNKPSKKLLFLYYSSLICLKIFQCRKKFLNKFILF